MRIAALGIGLAMACCPCAESQAVITADGGNYARVLDLIFAPASPAPKHQVFTITVRFRPSFEPESQITLRQDRGQTADVEYIVAKRQVYPLVGDFAPSTPQFSAAALAHQVSVNRRALKLPSRRAFALQASLFTSLNQTMAALHAASQSEHKGGAVPILLDGESYDLWYEYGMSKFSGSFSASEAGLATGGIGQWARALREEISKFPRGNGAR